MKKHKLILVTGDPICDHNFYRGKRATVDSLNERGVTYTQTGGGALLLKDLISETMKGEKQGEQEWVTEFGLDPDFFTLPSKHHAYCIWEPQSVGGGKDKTEYWRTVEPPLGYGLSAGNKAREDAYVPRPTPLVQTPDIVVIDDAGIGFREESRRNLWSSVKAGSNGTCPEWIVLKLTGPVGENPLWNQLAESCSENLVVIVPADELRRREVRLSKGLSWEATTEDLVVELCSNHQLAPLLKARHLIVTFQSDGAFWLDNAPGGAKALLVFDAVRAEGEWSKSQGKGGAFGYLSCFTAAIVRELCMPSTEIKDYGNKTNPEGETKLVPDFEVALSVGLGASRELRRIGHGEVGNKDAMNRPGFPFDRIAQTIKNPEAKFVSAVIPPPPKERGKWMMLDEWQVTARNMNKARPHFEAALAVAVLGPEALERFPVAQFGKYQTVDRKEIESLHRIQDHITTYRMDARPRTPLNLGVFAPQGVGKLFIVTQVAKVALRLENEDDILSFNLSQFDGPADLIGAFHQIRDKVISGITPLVFWDEFDSQDYKWLPYLLAPMQDGKFQEGQSTHPIGKCIFVFSTTTSPTYDKFGPANPDLLSENELEKLKKLNLDQLREMERAWREFILKKGPEFKSQLVGNLTVLGLNPQQICIEKDGRRCWIDDKRDRCYPIRRALFIRTQFKVMKGERLRLDLSILRALLEIPIYKSGGRSLHALCSYLGDNGAGTEGHSGLPEFDFLNLHVDAAKFREICEQDMGFVSRAKELAVLLHEHYRSNFKGAHTLSVSFAELPKDLQDANVAQIHRIPYILRIAGLHLEPGPDVRLNDLSLARNASEDLIRGLLTAHDNLELLAEAEHNGWMVEFMLRGWKFSRKHNRPEKLHNCLIPYSQLSEEVKNYNRWAIIGKPAPKNKPEEEQFGYVDIVKLVGLRVVMDEKPMSIVDADEPAVVPKVQKSKVDVFISYRRDGGDDLAARVKDALKSRGFEAFMDVEDLKSGRFDTALLEKIEEATDVIVILTPGCLDRCKNEDDWLRQEIRHAIKCDRNIVPIIARRFQMPLPDALPSDIAALPKYSGIIHYHEMFEASIDKLVSQFLKSQKTE